MKAVCMARQGHPNSPALGFEGPVLGGAHWLRGGPSGSLANTRRWRRRTMFRAYGLYGHIQANRLRSALLLAGFVALLHALLFSLLLIWSAFLGGTLDEIVAGATQQFARS